MIGATLERQGYDVQMASCGHEGLESLERNAFDLVLTDIVMQDGNGIALLERVHAQQPQLPVVMVTAIHDISVAIDSMRRGAYDYLLKPFRARTPGEHGAARPGTPAGSAGEPQLPAEP
jgi:DNA-binding NtrC family response regulator